MKKLNNKNGENNNSTYRIITSEQPSSVISEAYRRIKVGLEFTNVDKEIKVIQICSSLQGEGKTTTALNIAATYAEDENRVLIIDLDLRRPKIHRAFKVENKNGIADVIAGKISLEDAIKKSDNGLYLLNRGSKVPYPTVILNSDSMKQIFNKLRAMFDVIIVDCPPILAVSDAIIISKLCDCCLFVVSQSKTEKTVAKEAVSVLRQNNVNLVGCVFTEISNSVSGSYNQKYKYYYQGEYKDESSTKKQG